MSGLKGAVHKSSIKGHRDQNEDRHDCVINIDDKSPTYNKNKAPINYFAVYDGHGGKFVSTYLHEHLPHYFMDKRTEYPLKKTTIQKLYTYVQNELRTKHFNKACETGSTCCIVIQYKENDSQYLNILNTGDSRAILCRNNIAVQLTKDHKPHLYEEKARIKSLGGEITFDGFDWRTESGLSVSRAFGDLNAEPIVTCIPDVYKYKLTKDDKFMIVACDGLYDVLTSDYIINFVLENCYDPYTGQRINKNINIAKKLGNHAIVKGSTDNISIICVFFS